MSTRCTETSFELRLAPTVKALSRCAGGVQTLVMTHGSRHAARWPGLIRGCMAVTLVTTMQPFE